ncbi:MAG TPA: GDSL-type esterase/lipase family protein, partial [Planctomycetota bacterium]|nr:GDSL-type esterase/lipase family protein [Planctomycetota bacterium]
LSVVLALAIGEVFVRVFVKHEPGQLAAGQAKDIIAGDPPPRDDKKYDGIPVNINEDGYRDDEDFPIAKPAGEKRVLFLGDSFLYGAYLHANEVLPKVCERPGTRSISLCYPGWGTRHEHKAWELLGAKVQPDVLVLCFFVGNDVTETLEAVHYEKDRVPVSIVLKENHELVLEESKKRLHMRILECSKLFRLWESTKLYQRIAYRQQDPKAANGPSLFEDQYWRIEKLRIEQWRKGTPEQPWMKEAWELTAAELRALVADARKVGARAMVVVIPDEIQVDARKRAELCRRFGFDEKDYDLEQPQRAVKAVCDASGIPCVDVLPAFREQGSQGGLYRDLDTHWNAKGHALAASLVQPQIEKLLAP